MIALKKILEWLKAFIECEEIWLSMFVIFAVSMPLISEVGRTLEFTRTVGLFGLIYGMNGYIRAKKLQKRLEELERRGVYDRMILRKIKDRNG